MTEPSLDFIAWQIKRLKSEDVAALMSAVLIELEVTHHHIRRLNARIEQLETASYDSTRTS